MSYLIMFDWLMYVFICAKQYLFCCRLFNIVVLCCKVFVFVFYCIVLSYAFALYCIVFCYIIPCYIVLVLSDIFQTLFVLGCSRLKSVMFVLYCIILYFSIFFIIINCISFFFILCWVLLIWLNLALNYFVFYWAVMLLEI